MSGLAERMSGFREVIFGILGETATIGTDEIKGRFFRGFREINVGGGSFLGLDLSFDCQITDAVRALVEDDIVTIESVDYRFLRRLPDKGDESGKVTIELGRTQV